MGAKSNFPYIFKSCLKEDHVFLSFVLLKLMLLVKVLFDQESSIMKICLGALEVFKNAFNTQKVRLKKKNTRLVKKLNAFLRIQKT